MVDCWIVIVAVTELAADILSEDFLNTMAKPWHIKHLYEIHDGWMGQLFENLCLKKVSILINLDNSFHYSQSIQDCLKMSSQLPSLTSPAMSALRSGRSPVK